MVKKMKNIKTDNLFSKYIMMAINIRKEAEN
jgi:hypothetical protein